MPDEEKQFAIINIEGNNYLYSPLLKSYLKVGYDSNTNGEWVEELGSPFYFDTSNADEDYLYMISILSDSGNIWYLNNNTQRIVINTWNTPDDGDRWKIEEVGDFDPTEALRIAQGSLFAVTTNLMYDGEVLASETKYMPYGVQMPEPPTDWSNALVTLKQVGTHPFSVVDDTTVAYEAQWRGPFAFSTSEDDATWYNMTIRSDYMVGKTEEEPYRPVAVFSVDTLTMETFQWAFGGNPYKVKVYNRSTRFDEVLTLDGVNAVMRPGDYYWDILPNDDGFVLRVPGTDSWCLNQHGGKGGPLRYWESANSLVDNGSMFRVTEAPDFYDGMMSIIPAGSVKGDGKIYTLSGQRIDKALMRKGVYIIDGRKVVVR